MTLWLELTLRKSILDAGFMAGEVSDTEYLVVLNRWGYGPLAQHRELGEVRERRRGVQRGLEAGAGAGAVHHAERFVDSRRRGGDVPRAE